MRRVPLLQSGNELRPSEKVGMFRLRIESPSRWIPKWCRSTGMQARCAIAVSTPALRDLTESGDCIDPNKPCTASRGKFHPSQTLFYPATALESLRLDCQP